MTMRVEPTGRYNVSLQTNVNVVIAASIHNIVFFFKASSVKPLKESVAAKIDKFYIKHGMDELLLDSL